MFPSDETAILRAILVIRFISTFFDIRIFLTLWYGHKHDLVNRYVISVSQMTTDMFYLS